MGTVATLFKEPPNTKPSKKVRGRNPEIQAKQSECIADRYYYYSKIKSLRYSKSLKNLGDEFFLTECSVGDRLRAMERYLIQLKQNPLTKKQLEAKWPMFKFN